MNDINQVCQLINNQTHIDSYLSQKAKWIPIKFIFPSSHYRLTCVKFKKDHEPLPYADTRTRTHTEL